MKRRLTSAILCFCLVFCVMAISANAVEVGGIRSGQYFYIKNVASGKYVTVHNGLNVQGTNIYQADYSASASQRFKMAYDAASDSYELQFGSYVAGVSSIYNSNVELAPSNSVNKFRLHYDSASQKYQFVSTYDSDYAMTVCGTETGTGTGTSYNSPGNIFITYNTASSNQLWELVDCDSVYYNCSESNFITSVDSKEVVNCYGLTEPFTGAVSQKLHFTVLINGYYKISQTYNGTEYTLSANGDDTSGYTLGYLTSGTLDQDGKPIANVQFKVVNNSDNSVRIYPKASADRSLVLSTEKDVGNHNKFVPYTGASSQLWTLTDALYNQICTGVSSDFVTNINEGYFPFNQQTNPEFYTNGVLDWAKVNLFSLFKPGAASTIDAMDCIHSPVMMLNPSLSNALMGLGTNFAVVMGNGTNTEIALGSGESLTVSDIDALPANALRNCRLVLYIASNTGAGSAPLPTAAISRGAKTVVAFTGAISNDQAYIWTNAMIEALGYGAPVSEACAYATTIVRSYPEFRNDLGGVDTYSVFGAADQVLIN